MTLHVSNRIIIRVYNRSINLKQSQRKNLINTNPHILNQCKYGNLNAFREIVEQYQSFAYRIAFFLLYNEEDAKDVVQESFIRIWKHRAKINPNRKFSTWLYRIVTNLSIDWLRTRKKKHQTIISEFDKYKLTIETGDTLIDDQVTNKELVKLIKKLACDLSPKQKMVFLLRDTEDLSITEVAEITGFTIGSIKTNLYHARRTIRRQLEELINYVGQKNEM